MDRELISYLDNRLNRHSEELRRHFGVVAEELKSMIQLVAEGVVTVDEKLERFRQENSAEHDEIKSMIKFSYAELDRRIVQLEASTRNLEARVARLETART